jgi:hypothetical protein
MFDHFHDIGLPTFTESGYREMYQEAVKQRHVFPVDAGWYLCLELGLNCELWFHLNKECQHIDSVEPHFHGSTNIIARLERLISSDDYPLEGSIYCWSSQSPFVCSVPNIHWGTKDLVLPCSVSLQVTAFAQYVSYYKDEEEFRAHQRKLPLSPQYFIPAGLFLDAPSSSKSAQAQFAGTILSYTKRINPHSGIPFYTAIVETNIGTIDVVMSDIHGRELDTQKIIEGEFWLSANVKNISAADPEHINHE